MSNRSGRVWFSGLAAVAVVYAFVAALGPVAGDDLFFNLNTARWIVEHGSVPWVDYFSFTAQGQPWIYPVGGGLLFYGVWAIGGYSALALLGPLGCAATVALVLRRGSILSVLLAILVVPLIAGRCAVRADLFSTVLSAAFLALLWRYHTTGRARLWLLPALMVLWVNAHLGFFVGLGMVGAYVLVEVLELRPTTEKKFRELLPTTGKQQRGAAERLHFPAVGSVSILTFPPVGRLRHAWPWLLATFAATLVNPFGPWIYDGVIRQLAAPQLGWISEWAPVPLNLTVLSMIGSPDLRGAVLLVMILAVAIAMLAVWRRQYGAALLLLGAAMATAGHVRSESLLAIVTVVVGSSVLNSVAAIQQRDGARPLAKFRIGGRATTRRLTAIVAASIALVLICLRLHGTAWSEELASLPPDVPEGAIAFIERENIPAQILSIKYGAFFTWRLFPKYLDYYDARTIPFGPDAFARLSTLEKSDPGPAWEREADRYGINSIVAPTGPNSGFGLKEFCDSPAWAPVYLDQVAAVFVRRRPENEALIGRLKINCNDVALPIALGSFYDVGASAIVLQRLKRYPEALAAIQKAIEIAPGSAYAHLVAAELYDQTGRQSDALREYRRAAEIWPDIRTLTELADLCRRERRYAEEAAARRAAVALTWGAPTPDQLGELAAAEFQAGHPQRALEAIDRAIAMVTPPIPPEVEQMRQAILNRLRNERIDK